MQFVAVPPPPPHYSNGYVPQFAGMNLAPPQTTVVHSAPIFIQNFKGHSSVPTYVNKQFSSLQIQNANFPSQQTPLVEQHTIRMVQPRNTNHIELLKPAHIYPPFLGQQICLITLVPNWLPAESELEEIFRNFEEQEFTFFSQENQNICCLSLLTAFWTGSARRHPVYDLNFKGGISPSRRNIGETSSTRGPCLCYKSSILQLSHRARAR